MANLFDNQIFLEAFEGAIVFRDVPTKTDLLRIVYTPVDPNGLISGELGSIALSPIGPWQNIDGASAWVLIGGPLVINTLCRVAVSVAAVDADNIDVTFTVTNLSGSPVTSPKRLQVFLYDTSGAGEEDLAMNATWTGVSVGSLISGAGTNRAVAQTNAVGVLTIRANDPAVETAYATATSSGIPTNGAAPFVVARVGEGALVFP